MSLSPLVCLASGSPRRRELLTSINLPFFCRSAASEVEEAVLGEGRGEEAEVVASARARLKGESVLGQLLTEDHRVKTVLAADTVVHLGTHLLDKPSSPAEAKQFLSMLSGKRHGVVTALWLSSSSGVIETWRRTWVDFEELSSSLIDAYVATGEPFDKAGGYGIQGPGSVLIRGVQGCYYNVMGLPLSEAYRCLRAAGLNWPLVPGL